jgi:hypothetical protein
VDVGLNPCIVCHKGKTFEYVNNADFGGYFDFFYFFYFYSIKGKWEGEGEVEEYMKISYK